MPISIIKEIFKPVKISNIKNQIYSSSQTYNTSIFTVPSTIDGKPVTNGQLSVTVQGNTKTNILGSNGDFETDSNADGVADGWEVVTAGTFALATTLKTIGSKSQKMTGSASNPRLKTAITTLTSGRKYYLSGYIAYSGSITGLNLNIRMYNNETLVTATDVVADTQSANVFKRVGVVFTSNGAENNIRLCVNSNFTADVYFDGVMLVDLTALGLDTLNLTECHDRVNYINGTKSTFRDGGLVSINEATNAVSNGNFANGTTGWSLFASTLSASNNVLSVTGNGTGNYPQTFQTTGIPCVNGKKVYLKATVRVTNTNCSNIALKADGSTGGTVSVAVQGTPVQNQWYTLSGIATLSSSFTGNLKFVIYHYYIDTATANGKAMEIKEVMGVDLTAHGLDTLTVDQLNARFPDWFSGTKTDSQVVIPASTNGLQSVSSTKDELRVTEKATLIKRVSDWAAITSGTVVNTTNYPLMKVGSSFTIALTAGGQQTGIDGQTASANGQLIYELANAIEYDINVPIQLQCPDGLRVQAGSTITLEHLGTASDSTIPTIILQYPVM